MGRVGQFIDRMCREHPSLMRRVLDREFGPLNEWITETPTPCGCLIGSIALEADEDVSDRYYDVLDSWMVTGAVAYLCVPSRWHSADTAIAWENHSKIATEIGKRVAWISDRVATGHRQGYNDRSTATPESDARVVAMLKARICRSLGA